MAFEMYRGQVYRVDRGDTELVVLPAEFIPELNHLSESILSSRAAHSYNLVGHLNGVDIVKTSNLHFKTIMNKVTPALPSMTAPLKQRLCQDIDLVFPQSKECWESIEPLNKVVYCISSAFSMIAVGELICENPEHVRLMSEQAILVFKIVVIMRFVPLVLQRFLVWFLPAKWKLERNLKTLEGMVIPEVHKRMSQKEMLDDPNLLSWMIQASRNEMERDPRILSRLQAATASGGTHSVGMFIASALFDLVAHPELFGKIQEEIQAKQEEIDGVWDHSAYDSLYKLDSALKETARLGPPTMTVYNRQLQSDYTLSNGVLLRKGQLICVSACSIQDDDMVFPNAQCYDGLRAYEQSLRDGQAHPFKFVDGELGWGSGRWACPGRFLAVLETKIMLVKLLTGYDFKLLPGNSRPQRFTFHDFGFIGEHERLLVRRKSRSLIGSN
ncbi:Thromboxane-A synthase [Lecanora helva]